MQCVSCNNDGPFPMSQGRPRTICVACFNKHRRKLYARGEQEERVDPPKQPLRKTMPRAKRYLVTYAQNATPVHEPFMRALLRYCEHNDAKLIVIPGRYKNPTSIYTQGMASEEWWDPKLHPFLFNGTKKIGKHLTVYGDFSIQPTADHPLTGLEVFTGGTSAIFGHTKLQLMTVAGAERDYPRILTTTGAITRKNYTNTKAGKKGAFHHVLGAALVEQGSELFHLRQINACEDGSFIDLDTEYTPDTIRDAGDALALVCGDGHEEYADQDVLNATFSDEGSIVSVLRPERVVVHDLLHFGTRGHHTRKNVREMYARAHHAHSARQLGQKVEYEVSRAVQRLDYFADYAREVDVIASNHHEHFDRWLDEADPREDPINARFFHKMSLARIEDFEARADGSWRDAFEIAHRLYGKPDALKMGKVRFIGRDEPLEVGGVFLNFHGDKGPNGARGSRRGFARIGAKTIIGHSHSPGIDDGCYQTGVGGDRDQGYNHTPSSHLNTHCVEYANTKRSLINILKGSWRG